MRRCIQLGLLFASLGFAQIPQNLDFRQGDAGQPPPYWSADHASAEVRHENCAPSPACVVVTGGDLTQTLDAAPWRGKSIRLSGWLRDGAQLWLRVNRPNQPSSFENRAGKSVRSRDWTRSEVSLLVEPDAISIDLGVTSLGGNPAWVRDVSLEFEDGSALPAPVNLDFADGESGQPPRAWTTFPDNAGYRAVAVREDCVPDPACAILFAPPQAPAGGFGALMQTVDATPWRGKTVRLRAWMRLDPATQDDARQDNKARLWLQDRRNLVGQDIHDTSWKPWEVVRTIDPDSPTISFGAMIFGGGSVRIDGIFLDVIPASEAPATLSAAPATLPQPGIVTLSPSGMPSTEDARRIVNNAARIALAWNKGLPNFLCTQTVRRAENRDNKSWKQDDVLTVQLSSSDGKESHKLVAIDNRPAKTSYESVKGVVSEGEFGGVLSEIFRPGAAAFWWDSETTLRSHPAYIFRYDIRVAASAFVLALDPAHNVSRIVGHHGYVYIERDTGQVLRIVQIAYVPPNFPVRASTSTMDYDYSDIGGRQYVLPLKVELLLTTASAQFRNEIDFRDYRKFSAETNLSFDDPGPVKPSGPLN